MTRQLLAALFVIGLSDTAKSEPEIWACHGQVHSLLKGTSHKTKAVVLDAETNPERMKSFQILSDQDALTIKLRGELNVDLDSTGNNYRSLDFFEDGTGWEARMRTSTFYFKDNSYVQTSVRNQGRSLTIFADCKKF